MYYVCVQLQYTQLHQLNTKDNGSLANEQQASSNDRAYMQPQETRHRPRILQLLALACLVFTATYIYVLIISAQYCVVGPSHGIRINCNSWLNIARNHSWHSYSLFPDPASETE